MASIQTLGNDKHDKKFKRGPNQNFHIKVLDDSHPSHNVKVEGTTHHWNKGETTKSVIVSRKGNETIIRVVVEVVKVKKASGEASLMIENTFDDLTVTVTNDGGVAVGDPEKTQVEVVDSVGSPMTS